MTEYGTVPCLSHSSLQAFRGEIGTEQHGGKTSGEMRLWMAGKGKHGSRRTDETVRFYAGDGLQNSFLVGERVRYSFRVRSDGLDKKTSHASGPIAGKKDEYPPPRTDKGCHACGEDLQSFPEVSFCEEDPLWDTRASRRARGDDPSHSVLGSGEKIQRLGGEIAWKGKGKGFIRRKRFGKPLRVGSQPFPIKRALPPCPGHGFLHFFQLMPGYTLPARRYIRLPGRPFVHGVHSRYEFFP